jgi:hypothetical protein
MPPWIALFALVPLLTLGGILFLVRWVLRGGLQTKLFGSRVERVIGAMELDRRGILNSRLRVHKLTSPDRPIAIELTFTTFASWQRIPVVLTRDQARALARLLTDAADH